MSEVENSYKQIAGKFLLPDYEELDREFSLDDIESTKFLLNKIRQKISEKIEENLKSIEVMIQPDTELANLYEYRFISDEKREKIYKIFKKLMKFYRYSMEVSLINTDEENANFIKSFYDLWKKMKPDIISILGTLKRSWDIETSIKEDLSYLG